MHLNINNKMTAPHGLRSICHIFLDMIFPPKCLVCSRLFRSSSISSGTGQSAPALTDAKELLSRSLGLLTELCCWQCVNELVAISGPLCTCCGLMLKQPQADQHLCGNCTMQPKQFRMARAAISYNQQSTAIIHRFKYGGKIQLAKSLGGLMLNTYLQHWRHEDIDFILPVPLHNQKFRNRGFNQSHLMVNSWKEIYAGSRRIAFNGRLRTDLLIRSKRTVSQTGLGRQQRLENIKGAFSVRLPKVVDGKKILVVDDVYTTGATVDECARSLLKVGAAQVDILTLARAS